MKQLTDAQLAALEAAAPNLHNGTYTISHPDRHVTLRVRTKFFGKKGADEGEEKRVVEILNGPNNETDFAGVAFWDDERLRANVWTRFKETGPEACLDPIDGYHYPARGQGWSRTQRILAIFVDLAIRGERGYWRSMGYELLASTTCVRCNRKLTRPESIEAGIGPECASKAVGA